MRMPEDISRSEMETLIYEWINGRHAERNRAVLRKRLFDGITYEKLAEEFDLSVSQVKRILLCGTETLIKHMK